MNVWNFIGRLGGDAEVRSLPDGTPVTQFSVAVDAGFGQKKTTTWVRCSMFGTRGEKVAPYILKGDRIGVSGEAKQHTFTARDGTEKVSMEVRVNDISLLGDHRDDVPRETKQPTKQPEPQPEPDFGGDFDEDLPFSNYEYRTLV